MNNMILKEKLDALIKEEDFFKFEESLANFEKEYKTSDFYKKTKRPLKILIQDYKAWHPRDIEETVERIVNSLDEEKIVSLLDKLSQVFDKENQDILNEVKELNLHNFWDKE